MPTLVVLGTLASDPYAGMAWMTMQLAAGLRRLGHDVYYIETTCAWPYDPVRNARVCDADYALPYLERVASFFEMDDRWAYRRSYLDGAWFGLPAERAETLLRTADAVLNVSAATRPDLDGVDVGRLVYWGTDPVYDEVTYAQGRAETRVRVDLHTDVVTYGENVGTERSPVPPLPNLRARTRQPVLMEAWANAGPPTRSVFTTVGNYKQEGREVTFQGREYLWSKHRAFEAILDLPLHTSQPLELALNLNEPETIVHGEDEAVRARGMAGSARQRLQERGWGLADATAFTTDPEPYRTYIQQSRGEFTVAKPAYAAPRSGWFSERSACYLAAGRPVITQDTGFGDVLPTGDGLFAFTTLDEARAALDAVNANYAHHARAARDLADAYFRADVVLPPVIDALLA